MKGSCGKDAYWQLEDNTLTIYGTGPMCDYTLLDRPEYEKYKGSFERLVIKDGITEIGNLAFYNFENLKGDLVIPNSVTHIWEHSFYNCKNLNGFLVLSKNLVYIGHQSFAHCSGLTGNLIIPNKMRRISDGTFIGCSGFKGNLVLPNSLESIGYYSFAECGFETSLKIPDSVKEIGEFAFKNDKFKTVSFGKSLQIIKEGAFYNCHEIANFPEFPDSLRALEKNAFAQCKFEKNIRIFCIK